MTNEISKENPQVPASGFERTDDFYTDYANNIFLESSAWDLKMIFGQLDQSTTPTITEQRAAITIPWRQAKILIYFLLIHVRAHELDTGMRVAIPKSLLPQDPNPNNEPTELNTLYEYMRQIRKELFDEDMK